MNMYSLRIEAQQRRAAEIDMRARQELSSQRHSEKEAEEPDELIGAELPEGAESVEFSVGNPRVEHITGVVHLYRELQQGHVSTGTGGPRSDQQASQANVPANSSTAAAAAAGQVQGGTTVPVEVAPSGRALPSGRTPLLCCLAIPGDMSVADFCVFCGAYLPAIRSMRVLRREARQRVVCMVLIRLADQAVADEFFLHFDMRPFSSLEPEIVCRLVWVRDVQLLGPHKGGGGETSLTHHLRTPFFLPATPGAAAPPASAAQHGSPQPDMAAAGGSAVSTSGTPTASRKSDSGARDAGSSSSSMSSGAAAGAAILQLITGAKGASSGGAGPQAGHMTYARAAAGSSAGGVEEGAFSHAPSSSAVAQSGGHDSAHGHAGGNAQHHPHSHHTPGTELPTCPVCLERLDEHVSGIVTTVCNHQFHSECLQKWGDTSCPVCRYCTQPHAHSSRCASCGATADLWICLICGHVGCGRYREGHASSHWKSSSHCYALELETQRVWDYAGDNYVHRLIQSKTDGKLVEVPAPGPHRHGRHGRRHARHSIASNLSGAASCGLQGAGSGADGCSSSPGCLGPGSLGGLGVGGEGSDGEGDAGGSRGSSEAGYDDAYKEALMASKLDHIAAEYNHLLASQLDSQRAYYEGLLAQQASEADEAIRAAQEAAASAQAAAASASAAAREAERRRQALEKKLADSQAEASKAVEERSFLRSLNDQLLSNQKDLKAAAEAAKGELAARDATIADLQEQVRDLMVFIEAGRTIASMGEEVAQGTVLPVPAAAEARDSSKSSGRGRRAGGK